MVDYIAVTTLTVVIDRAALSRASHQFQNLNNLVPLPLDFPVLQVGKDAVEFNSSSGGD